MPHHLQSNYHIIKINDQILGLDFFPLQKMDEAWHSYE